MTLLNARLPAGWAWETIGDRYTITKRPRGLDLRDYATIPFVPMEAVPKGGREQVQFYLRRPDEIASGVYFERQDVLLGRITPSFENGKQGIATIPGPCGIGSTELIPLQAINGRANGHFLFYYLLHPEVRAALAGRMEGSTGRQRVPHQAVRGFPIPVPPRDEQDQIAALLRKVQQSLDSTDQMVTLLGELFETLLHAMMTPPAGWRRATIGDLFEIGAGKSVTPRSRTGTPRSPFLRTANVLWGHLDLSEVDTMHFTPDEIRLKSLREGDLLVCEGGDIGRAALWDGSIPECSFQNHLHRLRPRSPDIVPRFFMYYLQAGFTQLGIYEGAGNRTTIPNLSRSRLAALEVPNPARGEQQTIAAMLWQVQQALGVYEQKRKTLEDLFETLLHGLMTGTIRVTDLDLDTSNVCPTTLN